MAIGRFQRTLAGLLIASATYGIVYFLLLSFAITLGEAELASDSPLLAVRDTLMFLATLFGFPFMPSLSSSARLTWARQVFGSDSGAIIGLIALNSLVWGPLLFFGFRMVRARLQRGRLKSG